MIDQLDIYTQSIIVSSTQFAFMYFKTVNINANFEKNRFKLMWTGIIVHITWLISAAIGINALLNGNLLLVGISVISSVIGADLGLFERIRIKSKISEF